MSRLLLGVVVVLAAVPSGAGRTWGDEGHQVVAALAGGWLSETASAQVAALLQGSTLAEASLWPDAIKDQRRWEWARPLHYVNLPRGKRRYRRARDCVDDACAVEALRRFARLLADPERPPQVRVAALRFVVHLAGDLHQPLHAGYADDQGGNLVRVAFDGEPGWRLHAVWDFGLPALEVRGDWPAAAVRLGGEVEAEERADWARQLDPAQWAEESRALLLSKAYGVRNGRIGPAYVKQGRIVVRRRLQMAGARLAGLLQAIFDPGAESVPAWLADSGPGDHALAARLVESLD